MPKMDLKPNTHQKTSEVCIFLALYQGAPYLQAQLDSFAAQTHKSWSLIVSDDGSTDDGLDILRRFQAQHPHRQVHCRAGPQQGFVRNFLSLIQAAPDDLAFAALSDQDDIWFPNKLERAVRLLSDFPETQPVLYCASTVICNQQLSPIGRSPDFPRAPGFNNALVQSIGGGNTMVLNRAALDLARTAVEEATDPVAHDWWLYQLITGCGGHVIHDPAPVLSYRQHSGNLIGANLSLRAKLMRFMALLGGRFQRWNEIGLTALQGSMHRFTPQAQTTLTHYKAARTGPVWHRLRSLKASQVYRQSVLGTIALYLACLFNRI